MQVLSSILHFYSSRPHASHFSELPAKKSACLKKKVCLKKNVCQKNVCLQFFYAFKKLTERLESGIKLWELYFQIRARCALTSAFHKIAGKKISGKRFFLQANSFLQANAFLQATLFIEKNSQ
jgi:hypothetical protein